MELKNYKRVSTGSEFRDVVQTANDEPRFRANGHELQFDSANSDYVNIPNPNWATFGDVDIEVNLTSWVQNEVYHSVFSYEVSTAESINLWVRNNGIIYFSLRIGNTTIFDVNTAIVYADLGRFSLKSGVLSLNGSVLFDQSANNSQVLNSSTWKLNIAKRESQSIYFGNYDLLSFSVATETFNPTDINSNAQIVGSSGTVATVNTSHASGNSYILGTVFQKSSFALVGNGTTEKIVGHLGTELILTSTPLEGGFTLDGVIYNLQEGLGTEIKSTTGETATIQGFTGTGLNFGGWQKGNDIDGWTPYTIV